MPSFCDPMECSPPGSSVPGIVQARILKWVAMPSYRGSSQPTSLMSPALAGGSSSIPGWGRSTGDGIDYPLQYSWASPVAQLIKNPSAMQKTWVRSLGWEDPLKKEKATHSSILAKRISWTV